MDAPGRSALGILGVLLWSAASLAQQSPPAEPNPLVQSPDVVMAQCPAALAHITPGSTVTSGDWVQLQRTGCSGSCPAYTVRLYANGSVRWHGERFVVVPGDALAQVDAATAANLIQQMRDHGFASACGSYTRRAPGSATFITAMSIGSQTWQVRDYAASAPAWLRDFDDQIDAMADTHRWRHGDPARELFGESRLSEDARGAKPGRTMLMHAAGSLSTGAVQVLVEQRVPVDEVDASGWTALMYAAGAGSLDQVRQLLAAGADAGHRSRAGETVLFAAATSPENPVRKLQLLQRAGANVAATSIDGTTVLMLAAAHPLRSGVLKTLLDMGANPSMRNQAGKTAIDILDEGPSRADAPAQYQAARALLLHAH